MIESMEKIAERLRFLVPEGPPQGYLRMLYENEPYGMVSFSAPGWGGASIGLPQNDLVAALITAYLDVNAGFRGKYRDNIPGKGTVDIVVRFSGEIGYHPPGLEAGQEFIVIPVEPEEEATKDADQKPDTSIGD